MASKIGSEKSPSSYDNFSKYFKEYMLEKEMDKAPKGAKPSGAMDEGMPEEAGFDRLIKLAGAYASGGEKAAQAYIEQSRVKTSVAPPKMPETKDDSITSESSKSQQGPTVDMPGIAKAKSK